MIRNVMIAAPSHDGAVNVWHAAALAETCKIGLTKNINVFPIYMSFDSLVQRARNDIIKLAIETGVDDLVFIDTDQDWNPEDFFKLLDHDVDVVGCPVPKKADQEQYNVKLVSRPYEVNEDGLVAVDSVGTGFLRLTLSALEAVWEASEEYIEDSGKQGRMVFNVEIHNGRLTSEDVVVCTKLNNLGFQVYLDPTINSAHSGEKRWLGNFEPWIEKVLKYTQEQHNNNDDRQNTDTRSDSIIQDPIYVDDEEI